MKSRPGPSASATGSACGAGLEVLESVTAAGGRLDLGTGASEREIGQIEEFLAGEGLLPHGQRLAHEPLRMDPVLEISVYLEPDFPALTPVRAFTVGYDGFIWPHHDGSMWPHLAAS